MSLNANDEEPNRSVCAGASFRGGPTIESCDGELAPTAGTFAIETFEVPVIETKACARSVSRAPR